MSKLYSMAWCKIFKSGNSEQQAMAYVDFHHECPGKWNKPFPEWGLSSSTGPPLDTPLYCIIMKIKICVYILFSHSLI